MRSRLLQSFLYVLGFWWIATALYWSVSDPDLNLASLQHVLETFPWLNMRLPEHVTVLDAWAIQKHVLKLWSGPVIAVTLLSALMGVISVWIVAWTRNQKRAERIKRPESYRGVGLSLGSLPTPQTPPIQPVSLKATDAALKALTSEQRALLTEILGLLSANREVFAGDNQPAGSLLPNTLKAAYRALLDPLHPGCAAIVVAASELGKITAWKKDDEGAWVRTKHEQREAARLLAALPSWWAMPLVERLAVLYAVKYRGQIEQIPDTENLGVYRLTRTLLDHRVEWASALAMVENEQTKAYEQREPEVELLELFERELAMFPFQTAGLPKNVLAVGWKRGKRAYLLQNRMAEILLPKMRPELKAAYAPTREKGRIEPLTAALLKIFNDKGWLVRKNGTTSLSANEAVWIIKAGTHVFENVIILELPEDLLARLPPKDSYYEVTINRPQYQAPLSNSFSKGDLMGGMLRPKKPASDTCAEKSATPEKHS